MFTPHPPVRFALVAGNGLGGRASLSGWHSPGFVPERERRHMETQIVLNLLLVWMIIQTTKR